VFAVTLDTQAVDLDGYDLRGLTALRTDQGRELQPTSRELRIAGGVLAFGSLALSSSFFEFFSQPVADRP